ncbi:MAG: hypothetical protein JO092_06275 [Candidatus Eremiobacteraeota bacterium]|nr:hypothetical protein [Candidatus Eremiobacteraeota bacterium]
MAERDAAKARPAWGLLAISAFGLAMVGVIVWMSAATATDAGLYSSEVVRPYVLRLAPEGNAARSGLRTGDLVDLRLLAPAVRYRLTTSCCRIGERMPITVLRADRIARFVLTPGPPPSPVTWDLWLAYAGNVWVLLFAALIAWRRPQDPEARTLSLFLSTMVIWIAFDPYNWATRWPAADAWLHAASAVIGAASSALFVTYAMLFARPPSLGRRVLAWLAYVGCGLSAIYGIFSTFVNWTAALDPLGSLFGSAAFASVYVIKDGTVLVCAIAALAATRGAERTRLSWAMSSIGLWYLVNLSRMLVGLVSPATVETAVVQDVANFVLPLGLTYSVLNRRLLDIGFALNRATVFTIVSVIVVGAFIVAEWLMGTWLASQSHVTNLAVNAALVIALGFSSRGIHHRVDHVVDHVFFRKRHEDEQAIREYAREAAYATEPDALLNGAVNVLKEHADAASVSIAIDNGQGRYGDVDAQDPAIVALASRHKPVDLHGMRSAFRGEFAYPMLVGKRLIGVLVLGPKRDGESYAPDESHAIAELAQAVGTALALQAFAPREDELSSAIAARLHAGS